MLTPGDPHPEPSDAQPGSVLQVPDAVTRITWTGALDGDILRTQAGYDVYPLDWAAVVTDGYGEPYDNGRATELFLGRYDDVDEADDVAGRMLDLEATASEWWTMPLSGQTDAELEGLASGVYVVGVRCGTCLGPVPLWMAGVEVR